MLLLPLLIVKRSSVFCGDPLIDDDASDDFGSIDGGAIDGMEGDAICGAVDIGDGCGVAAIGIVAIVVGGRAVRAGCTVGFDEPIVGGTIDGKSAWCVI